MFAALVSVMLAPAACGGGSAASSGHAATPTLVAAATANTDSSPVTGKTLLVPLVRENGGLIAGILTIVVGQGRYSLSVQASGLHPQGRYHVIIHAGGCGPLVPLGTSRAVGYLTGDAAGNGVLQTIHPQAYSVPAEGLSYTVHGYNGSGDEFLHVACAELPVS